MELLKKLLVLMIMLLVPLQGGAASVAMLTCHDPLAAAHASVDDTRTTGTHAVDSALADDGSARGGTQHTGGDVAAHDGCCYVVFSLPSIAASLHLPASPVWVARTVVSFPPFFPEQPHRPPIA